MEGNGRRLAWIAIALSALALVVSLGGRMGPPWRGGMMMHSAPAAGFSQRGQMPFGPQGDVGPQGNVGPQDNMGPRGGGRDPFFDQRGGPGPFGRGNHGGPGMFFFWPFMLLGKLFKLAFVVLLIWLGVRLLNGKGFGWRGPRGPNTPPPSRPGPEQPPYTGDTEQI